MTIRFGTDGWRGVIAEDFTFGAVRRAAQAVADLLREQGAAGARVPVGHDVRFLGRRFARDCAEVLAANGFRPILPDGAVTTPMVSCQVVARRAPLGLMITASHNPPEWNGLKVKAAFGGSAPEETTRRIETLFGGREPSRSATGIAVASFLPAYRPRIGAAVDLRCVRRSRIVVVVDSMHGAGGRIVEGLLRGGRARVVTIRSEPDPTFGGAPPEPRADLLGPLSAAVRRHRAHIGFATDGDGDRIGVADETGRIVPPTQVFALLADHLLATRGERGAVARTFANTLLAERIARRHGVPFHDLPIGFKHVARLMRETDVLIGGEESGGIGVRRFLPERDGLLVGLLLMEMLASGERRLSRRIAALQRTYGAYDYRRVDLPLAPESGRRTVERLREAPPARLAGCRVHGVDALDGVKLLLGDAGWILFRASGTEPVLRVYCEAATPALVRRLLRAGVARVRAVAS